MLQKGFEGAFQQVGKRHQKNEKPEWKRERAQGLTAEAPAAGPHEEQPEGKGRPGEGIGQSEVQPGTERKKVSGEEEEAGGEREGGEFAIGLGIRWQGVLFQPSQVKADERDQENVGIQLAVEREAGEGEQRLGETGRQDHGAKGQAAELTPE